MEIINLNKIKTKNDQELIKRIKEVENKYERVTKDLTNIKKEKNLLVKKNKILEETIREGYIELDKQVQLKEKIAEEKKMLDNIIKTHKDLRGLKKDLNVVLSDKKQVEPQENNSDDDWEDVSEESSSEKDIDDQEFVKILTRNMKKRNKKNIFQKDNPRQQQKHYPAKKSACEKCEETFETGNLLETHIKTKHTNKVPIKCIVCEFVTQSQTQFLLHMESHNHDMETSIICKYFLQGICRFGIHYRNQHRSIPQCKFRSRCSAWPVCNFAHYEVCDAYQDCKNKRCPLGHPQKPFLVKNRTSLPPDLKCQSSFPRLPKIAGRMM